MTQFNRDRRSLLFFGAAATSALATLVRWSLDAGPVTFEALAAVACFGVGVVLWRTQREAVRFGALAAVSGLFLVVAPYFVLTQGRPNDIVVLLVLPLALTVLFMERLGVVLLVCLYGAVVNPLTLYAFGWSGYDIMHSMAAMLALYGAGVVGALQFARTRAAERQHHDALQKLMAAQLQSERLVVLGSLASGVAHEVNNPLSYVQANVQHLRANEARDAERDEVWGETVEGLRRIGAVVSDLQGLARPGDGQPRPVDMDDVLKRMARLAKLRGSSAEVKIEVAPGTPQALANPQRLQMALANLVINACEALSESKVSTPCIALRARAEGGRLRVEVEDNGPGIPEAVAEQLFTPFFTTRAGVGTGLGLATSREYLESFGGSLALTPRGGLGGAHFQVTLPVAAD